MVNFDALLNYHMGKTQKASASEKLAEIIVEGIQDKKGSKIQVLDLRNIANAISDFFIICHGSSNRQVDSIADSVHDMVREQVGEKPINTEGKTQAEWILMDYVNVVVHIFQEEQRDHYALDELWADAKIKLID
ncbi:MAG: ribosome silencing factor [Salibacteraceae bacterium]